MGNNGMFLIPTDRKFRSKTAEYLFCLVSDGGGWEHVSVSLRRGPKHTLAPGETFADFQPPTWSQMCMVKALFWDPEEMVLQYHPPESEYVNVHPAVLHLWRPVGKKVPTPPVYYV
jgi:hypothetical protein